MVGSVQVHNRRESVALDIKAYSHLSAQERIRIDELRNRDGLGGPPDRPEDRPRQVHRQPRAGTRPVVRVRRERVLPPLPAETAEGRDACARIPQAPAHVLPPVARMGDGRAQEGVDAGKDRGAAEGRMAGRPAHADKPRVPPPVDPRETAEGVGPQAVPAQENQLRRPDGRGPAGHRPGDQRHPHEGPGLGNAQRGLVPRARQGNVKDKPPKDECCTYKLNPGYPTHPRLPLRFYQSL